MNNPSLDKEMLNEVHDNRPSAVVPREEVNLFLNGGECWRV